jgi:UDP-GlcNAc:undecaprenyl-phosphate GlcNAc-1-phosphate transferase
MLEGTSQTILDLQADLHLDAGAPDVTNLLTFILPLIAALVISMVVIPVMVRLAPRLGMIDMPDPRKVHAKPVPRVGGVGIFLGALVPIVLLLPIDQSMAAYISGAVVLFTFGAMDDCRELGHYVKFVGQFIAVIVVVYIGDVYVTLLPFMGGEHIPEIIGRPFTVVAMVGMINAINHSDGLDGLAGGESLLSLCAIAYLSYLAGGVAVTIIALAMIGGLFGFMRFNTYPAIIFMGDGGSQFVGYTLGFLAVLLTQDVNPVLSPALPVLFLGLPIADIIAVFFQRIYHRMNWFQATRNHIHHRLLDLGFQHYESVVVIYSIQALLVICAVMLPYESDAMVLGLYMAIVSAVFLFLYLAGRSGWRIRKDRSVALIDEFIESAKQSRLISAVSYGAIVIGLSAFLVSGSFLATEVPPDFTLAGMVIFGLTLVRLFANARARFLPLRVLCYMTIVFVVYLVNIYQPKYMIGMDPVTYLFFGAMVCAIALAIRYSDRGVFSVTPTDFLVIFAVSSLAILSSKGVVDASTTAITLKAIILLYGCELVLNRMKSRWNVFTLSVLLSLGVISVRGMSMLAL